MREINQIMMDYIWWVTLYAAMLSVGIFFTLAVLRFFSNGGKRRKLARSEAMKKQLLVYLEMPLKNLKHTLVKNHQDMELLAHEALFLLRTLKGTSRQRLLDVLDSVGLKAWSLNQLHAKKNVRRISAIHLAAFWVDNSIKEQLVQLLDEKHPLVRYAALEALASLKDDTLLPKIVDNFEKKQGLSASLMADVLQKFGSDISERLVAYILAENVSTLVRKAMMITLLHTHDNDAMHAVGLAMIHNEDEELRALGYSALLECDEEIEKDVLALGVRDTSWRVRQYVADCTSHSASLPADILTTLFQDENWLVGLHAGQALYRAGNAGITLLETFAEHNSLAGNRARMILAEQKTYGGETYGMA